MTEEKRAAYRHPISGGVIRCTDAEFKAKWEEVGYVRVPNSAGPDDQTTPAPPPPPAGPAGRSDGGDD